MTDNERRAAAFLATVRDLPRPSLLGLRPVAKLDPAETDMDIDQWRAVIDQNFPDLRAAAETCLSVVCQLLVHEIHNPFCLILIDRPSSGKTIVINMFEDITGLTYATDQFTPAAFVSNIAGRSQAQLKQIDLLPRIKHKTLLVRELGTMFSENEDALRQRMGMLTRILDGEGFKTESGVYGQRGYKGDYLFMMLAASTPFPLRIWKVMTNLGHRLFFHNVNTRQPTEEDLYQQLMGTDFKIKERLCRDATSNLIRSVWARNPAGISWNPTNDDPAVHKWINRYGLFLARFRGDIIVYEGWVDGKKEVTSSAPQTENPSRINQCLYNLCRGHAVACGRTNLTLDDLGVALRTMLDTAPGHRVPLLHGLLQKAGKLTTYDVRRLLRCDGITAKKEMHKLVKLEICSGEGLEDMGEEDESAAYSSVIQTNKNKYSIDLHPDFNWFREEFTVEILEKMGYIR